MASSRSPPTTGVFDDRHIEVELRAAPQNPDAGIAEAGSATKEPRLRTGGPAAGRGSTELGQWRDCGCIDKALYSRAAGYLESQAAFMLPVVPSGIPDRQLPVAALQSIGSASSART